MINKILIEEYRTRLNILNDCALWKKMIHFFPSTWILLTSGDEYFRWIQTINFCIIFTYFPQLYDWRFCESSIDLIIASTSLNQIRSSFFCFQRARKANRWREISFEQPVAFLLSKTYGARNWITRTLLIITVHISLAAARWLMTIRETSSKHRICHRTCVRVIKFIRVTLRVTLYRGVIVQFTELSMF